MPLRASDGTDSGGIPKVEAERSKMTTSKEDNSR